MCAEGVTLCAEAIASVWGLGFALVLVPYLAAYCVGVAKTVIRKL